MARIIDIDPTLLRRAHENFWLDLDDVSPGAGLDGREQIVFTENRRWIGRLDFVRLRPSALQRATVIGDQLRGRANKLRLTLCNYRTPRFSGSAVEFYRSIGVTEEDLARGHLEFSDGSNFSDGTGFALPDHSEPVASEAAPAGADVIKLDGFLGRNLAVAAFFSIADFLYRVESNADGVVRFNPPLRQAVKLGEMVRVSRPKVQVRLSDKSEWRPFCEYFRNGQAMTVNVVEAFDR